MFMVVLLSFVAGDRAIRAQWQEQPLPTVALCFGIHALDGQNAMVVGDFGSIYRTVNGGNSWFNQGTGQFLETFMTFDSLAGVHMIDQDTWIVAGYNPFELAEIIIRTADGGQSWTMVHLGPDFTGVYDMDFPSPTVGLTVGKQGRILRTTDAGLTWSPVPTPVNGQLNDLDMETDQVGYVAGHHCVLRTSNGGASWVQLNAENRNYLAISAAGQNVLYATSGFEIGSSGDLLRSVDGGVSWSTIETPFHPQGDLHAISPDTVLVAGSVLYASFDGGAYWFKYPETDGHVIHDLNLDLPGHGFMVGSGGSAFRVAGALPVPSPVAVYEPIGQSICMNDPVTVFNRSAPGYSYAWFVDGTLVANTYHLTHAFTSPGSTDVRLEVSDGVHTDVFETSVNVNSPAPPVQSFSWSSPNLNHGLGCCAACTGLPTDIYVSGPTGQQYRVEFNGVPMTPWDNTPGLFNNLPVPADTQLVITVVGRTLSSCDTAYLAVHDTVPVFLYPADLPPGSLVAVDSTFCWGDTVEYYLAGTQPGVLYSFQGSIDTVIQATDDTLYFHAIQTSYSSVELVRGTHGLCRRSYGWPVDIEAHTDLHQVVARSVHPDVAVVGQPVSMLDNSIHDSEWTWDFGSTAVPPASVQENPAVVYTVPDWYTPIDHAVRNTTGCADTISSFITVADPADSLLASICSSDTVSGAHSTMRVYPLDMVVDRWGNRYVTGAHRDVYPVSQNYRGHGLFLIKYNASGDVLWEIRTPQQTNSRCVTGTSLAVGEDGSVYLGLTGADVTVQIGGESISLGVSNDRRAGVVVKLDSTGLYQWHIRAVADNSNNPTGLSDLLVGRDGSIYFALAMENCQIFFPNGATVQTQIFGPKFFVVKADPDGNFISYNGPSNTNGFEARSYHYFDDPSYPMPSFWVPSTPELMQNCDGRIIVSTLMQGNLGWQYWFGTDTLLVDPSPLSQINQCLVIADVDENLTSWGNADMPWRSYDQQYRDFAGDFCPSHIPGRLVALVGGSGIEPAVGGQLQGYHAWERDDCVIFEWDVELDSVTWMTHVPGLSAVEASLERSAGGYVFVGCSNSGGAAAAGPGTLPQGSALGVNERALVVGTLSLDGSLTGLEAYPSMSKGYGEGSVLGGMTRESSGKHTFLVNPLDTLLLEGQVLPGIEEFYLVELALDGDCAFQASAGVQFANCDSGATICAGSELGLYWDLTLVDSADVRWRFVNDTTWRALVAGTTATSVIWTAPDTISVDTDVIVWIAASGGGGGDSLLVHITPWWSCSSLDLVEATTSMPICTPSVLDVAFAATGVVDSLDLFVGGVGGGWYQLLASGLSSGQQQFSWSIPDTSAILHELQLTLVDPAVGWRDSIIVSIAPSPEVEIIEALIYCPGDTVHFAVDHYIPVSWVGMGDTLPYWVIPGGLASAFISISAEDIHGCWDQQSLWIQITNCVGIAEVAGSGLVVYPNPAGSVLNVMALQHAAELEILDAGGRTLWSGGCSHNSCSVDLEGFASGVYLLRTRLEGGQRFNIRFVKD